MRDGSEGWTKPGGHPEVELNGFQPIDLGDGQMRLRFDPVKVPEGAEKVAPTLTLTRNALNDLAARLRLLAGDLPQSRDRH